MRPPRGFDPAHELIEDLKRKDYICSVALDDEMLTGVDLLKTLVGRFAQAAPMIDWLCGALDLEF